MTISLQDSKNQPETSALGEINKHFHKRHEERKRKHEMLICQGEILLFVRIDSRLIVMHGRSVSEYDINTEKYHSLKAAIHATLAAYYTLIDGELSKAVSLIRSWTKHLTAQSDLQPAIEIAKVTEELLDEIEEQQCISYQTISKYTSKLEPIFSKMMMLAAQDEIEQLVIKLDEEFRTSGVSSDKTFLVVFGGHQPRYRELAKLVFTRWYNELEDHILNADHHVRYLEGGENLDDAVDLIATVLSDRELAKLFMGSAQGLDQDALGVIGEKALDKFWAHRESSRQTELL